MRLSRERATFRTLDILKRIEIHTEETANFLKRLVFNMPFVVLIPRQRCLSNTELSRKVFLRNTEGSSSN